MLTVTRKALQAASPGGAPGRYRQGAFVLLLHGEVIGEIIVLAAAPDPWNPGGAPRVRLGLNLLREIEMVRADAVDRPRGPSHEWLVGREQWFGECVPNAAVNSAAPVDAPQIEPAALPATISSATADDPSASSSGRYVFRSTSADDPNSSYTSSPAPRPAGRHADRRWEA